MFHYRNDEFISITYMNPCDEYGAIKVEYTHWLGAELLIEN